MFRIRLVLALALVGMLAVGVAAAAPIKVLLKLDEGQGDVAYDSSGNGFHGKLVNNPAWVEGKSGKALQFSGTAGAYDNVVLPIGPNDIGDAGTVMFWFKPDWTGIRMRTLFEATYPPTGRGFFVAWGEEGSFLEFTLEDKTDADWEAEALGHIGEPKSGNWYHIAAVWDFTNLAQAYTRLYVNGEKWGEAIAATTGLDTLAEFTIGSQNCDYWAQGSAEGIIDEFVVYAGALSADEIQQAYAAAK
jgi:hypothetical protein